MARRSITVPLVGLSEASEYLLFFYFFFFLVTSVQGHFVVEKSSVSVLSPSKYKSKHDSAIANFGIPDYGGSIIGVVVRPSKNVMACDPFDETFKSSSGRPVFLLVDRGGCYFAKKAYYGQIAGADAVLVSDNVDEPLITMDSPHRDTEGYADKLTIPSTLITKKFGDTLKEALKNEDTEIILKLDWSESMPHPDNRVEYEFWTNSNDECGKKCDIQMKFVKEFRGHAQLLEKGGFTMFTPRYITWYCPQAFVKTKQCKSQCINKGRYCAPDPELNFEGGYEGKDVLRENLRQICVHRVANESGRSWIWWDFVTDFHIRCSMKDKKYSKECAETVIQSLGLSKEKIDKCMGDPDADAINPVLQEEQSAQVGKGSRSDVTYLPTLVINDIQYRGRLDRTGVLKAICAGFEESTEPPVCLSSAMETNQCLDNNGGCWLDTERNISACKDTFRGRICECPIVHGVQYTGDGYTSCKPEGPARCSVNNGGCWSETVDKKTFSACVNSDLNGCRCPVGFKGDGKTCTDVDECKERSSCQCSGCSCRNKYGGYDCKCSGDLVYIQSEDTCIARNTSKVGSILTLLLIGSIVCAGLAGYIFYKYRLRSYMDSEITAIMSQYMPLDNHQNESRPLQENSNTTV